VLVGGCVHVIDSWIKHRGRRPDELDEELAATLEKVDLLEDRIRVLERIVTESRVDLKKQIDSL